jgi:hypothetical protein
MKQFALIIRLATHRHSPKLRSREISAIPMPFQPDFFSSLLEPARTRQIPPRVAIL